MAQDERKTAMIEERLLAQTLALKSARAMVAKYKFVMEILNLPREAENSQHVLFQIDSALGHGHSEYH